MDHVTANDLLMLSAEKFLDKHERDFMELLDNPLYAGEWLFMSEAVTLIEELREKTKQARKQVVKEVIDRLNENAL